MPGGGPPRRRETVSLVICLVLYGGLLVRANSFTAGGEDSPGYLNAARLPFEEADFERNLLGRWERIGTVRDIGLWRLN
jgi:hypothetical protein